MILLACATSAELAFLEKPEHVTILVTGIGPVEAAANVSRALALGDYDAVVSAGICGVMRETGSVGESFVVSDEMIELDLETGMPIPLPPGMRVVERASSDLAIVDRLVERGFRAVRGATVARVTATDATARRLLDLGAHVESMEGFGVLRAAEIAGVRAVEVRGASNYIGDRTRSAWDFAAGVAALERILLPLLGLVLAGG